MIDKSFDYFFNICFISLDPTHTTFSLVTTDITESRLQGSTQTGKPGKMGKHFPVREKSGNFEQTGKVRENDTKYWKIQEISEKILSVIFSDI